MSKNYQKSTYTMDEIGTWALNRWPDRFQDFACAKATMHYFRRQLGVNDINGRTNYIQISASDAERLKEYVASKYASKAPAAPIIAPPPAASNTEPEAPTPGVQLSIDDFVQDQLNQAVALAFREYLSEIEKADSTSYWKGYADGYRRGCQEKEVKPEKWEI